MSEAAVTKAARALCDIAAAACNINAQDNWDMYADSYRADAMAALNAAGFSELLVALREAVDLAWIEDSHQVQFDSTVLFSTGYDFSGLDGSSRIELLGQHECVVWRSGGRWSAYCTHEGSMWFERFDSAEDAKEQCMRLLDRVMPDHPAMRARAAIAKATGVAA